MKQKLLIRDLTLRDGQQSAFATRMTQQQIDRVLPFYRQAAFYAMEVWGGAVPDSVMRYLNENPWSRLEKIKAAVGDVSKLTALSRGRNLFGYSPYTDEIIDGFSRNAIESGLDIMRIFDALNDVENVKSTIKYVKKYGGIADCAVCYTIDPHFSMGERLKALLKGKKLPGTIFTDEYFLDKAKQMAALGADMITIKDMSGLIPPKQVAGLIKLFKQHIDLPIDFHTHCTPGYGLASVVSAIVNGASIVDTNIWNFAGGPAAPAIELIYVFCKKLDIEMDVNMEAVAKINQELLEIRKELAPYDAIKQFPVPFNPLTDTLPIEIEHAFDRAVVAVRGGDEKGLVDACHVIERYFNFPSPNELVQKAEIPGGMYTNMVAQLKQLKSEAILESAMKLIPRVRLDAGLSPLVTPTSQIVGAQAVNCALDIKNGKPLYSNVSNQFVNLVKGEYGETPFPIDPAFRFKIAGVREQTPYDTSNYQMQPNPTLEECGGVKLAENEKEVLLLELFPAVAKTYLTEFKKAAYWKGVEASAAATQALAGAGSAEATASKEVELAAAAIAVAAAAQAKAEATMQPITGQVLTSPMPGRIFKLNVKVGERVKAGEEVIILEAMKMENSIAAPCSGEIKQIFVGEGDPVAAEGRLLEIV